MPSHGMRITNSTQKVLASAAQVLAAEDVAEDPEQAHEPGEEQEELEQGEQERAIVVEHSAPFVLGV